MGGGIHDCDTAISQFPGRGGLIPNASRCWVPEASDALEVSEALDACQALEGLEVLEALGAFCPIRHTNLARHPVARRSFPCRSGRDQGRISVPTV